MNKRHITKEGIVMFISQMDDIHLNNYILLVLRGIEKAKLQLRAGEVPQDKFSQALYPDDEGYSEEALSEMINELTNKLYPYLAEIALRGIDMSEKLQEVFERNGSLEKGLEQPDDEFQLLLDNMGM